MNNLNIDNNKKYYSGMISVPSVSNHFVVSGRKTTSEDAAHFQGWDLKSYRTLFEAAGYNTNNQIQPLVFFHSKRQECEETRINILMSLEVLIGFDFDDSTMILDQEKFMDTSLRAIMEKYIIFWTSYILRRP